MTESPELIDPVVECADWVRFSIDAVSDDAYRVVHGRPFAAFQPLRAMVASLVRRAAARRAVAPAPRIGIKLIVQRPNQHQILTAVDEALNLGVDYLQFKWLDGHPWSIPCEERPVLSATLEERLRDIPGVRLTVDVLPGYARRDSEIIVCQRTSLSSFSLPASTNDPNWAGLNLEDYPWANLAED